MQRYRVNLPLLIGLVVGVIALAGGSYGLYTYQKSQNASRLLDREQAARAEGDLEQSSKLLVDYLRIRPGDKDAMTRLSVTLADMAEQPTAEPVDFRNAMGQLEATVRDFPEEDALRRRLVDLYMSHRGYKQALDHVSQLLNHKPNDPELEGLLSQCYFATANPKALKHGYDLIGYDQATDEFDESKARAPHDIGVYGRVARSLRNDQDDVDLADRVIDQMIEANPETGKAYLARGQYLEANDQKDEAVPDVQKALELDSEDPSIVIANARLALRDEDLERAKSLLENSLEKNPDSPGLYQTLAEVAIRNGDYEEALAVCDRGIDAVRADQTAMLMFQKARLQLQSQEPDATRKTIAEMREQSMMPSLYPDYLEARLLMSENKWFEAVQIFKKYQVALEGNPALGVELNVMLGLSQEKLGQDELALDAFNQALVIEPENAMADLGRQRVMQKIGRVGGNGDQVEGVSIYSALAKELAKPESEQDWEAFDQVSVDYIKRMQMSDAMLAILRGEVFMRRGEYEKARVQLKKSFELDPDNLGVRRAAVKLFAADPEQGPVKALGLLDTVVKKFGDLPILRLERADLLSSINDENLTEQLLALGDGTNDWTTDQKVQLWKGLADKFSRLRNDEARSEALRHVAELAPNDLPSLLEMFEVARAANDVAGMQDAQQSVLDVVGSKEDATWQYTEARRLLSEWRAAGGSGDGAKRAEELVDRAISQRKDWHELHNLKADISLARGDIRGALASYDRAANLGRQDARAMYQYIKLLMARNRFADALVQMERIGHDGRIRLLGVDYAEALLRVGRGPEAIVAAEEFAQEAPNNATAQLWLGRFYSRASMDPSLDEERKQEIIAKAGEAFARSIELNPKAPDAWLALVGYYAATRDMIKADDSIREAQIALIEDQNQLLFARCYELVGRAIDAEALYEQAYEDADATDRSRVARLLAQFYLGQSARRPDSVEKATPLINQILKDAAEGTIPEDDTNAQWARTTAARLLAQSGAYQDLLNAERLIASNSEQGDLAMEDRMLMAEILAPRPEPVSRKKAVRLLEEISANQRLSKEADLELGRLYFALGNWRECREQMLNIIARYPDDKRVRVAYIEMLLERGGPSEIDLAVRQVQRLRELAPGDLATRELIARVAFEKGKKQQAADSLASLIPKDPSKATAENAAVYNRIAQRLVEFGDLEKARRAYTVAANVGGPGNRYALALFIGQNIDSDQGLEDLEKLRDDVSPSQLVNGGLSILRAIEAKGEELPPAAIERVEGWLERSLREDPDLISLRLQRGELLDLRRQYEEAAEAYRELLARSDLKGNSRAVVLNNLAYLLALSQSDKESINEANQYVTEAVDLLGPGSEILDTRAVIAIAGERYEDAIADLDLALIDRKSASKYFHLAYASAKAGRKESAEVAWKEALDRGLTRESVSRLEREQFDELQGMLEGA